MSEQFSRTRILLGTSGLERLQNSRVAVFGIGGVGGFCVEALVRSGVGAIDIIDSDEVSESNLNRQIIATHDTLGLPKVDAMEARIRSINPACTVRKHRCFYLPETRDSFDFALFDYVVDAVDTLSAKIDLVMAAKEAAVPIISSMGAGNKLDPTAFRVADIYETSVCPLAKCMRKELRKREIGSLKVVYSQEPPLPASPDARIEYKATLSDPDGSKNPSSRRPLPGSIAFVPSVVGLIIAGEVIKDLAKSERIEHAHLEP